MTPGIFAPVLEWLASGTGDEARESLEFHFDPPATPPAHAELQAFALSELGVDVMPRFCCALGGSQSPSVGFADLGFHKYRPRSAGSLAEGIHDAGGKEGYLYTRRGGFIDLGHVRDYIDYTRFFAARYDAAPHSGQSGESAKLWSEAGDIHLITAPRSERPSSALAAIMGAKLAYERAIWHEIVTYFPGTVIPNQRYSSFAPEDNFSNAVGALVGYYAVLTPNKRFDAAAEKALFKTLAQLGPVLRPEDTDAAVTYVQGHWWSGSGPTPPAKRRNFDAFSPVRPWLVTDIAITGKEAEGNELRKSLGRARAASIHIPVQHNSQPLDSLAHFEVTNAHASIRALVPTLDRIRGSDFPTLVTAIREQERVGNTDADSPGPPVP
jgi:Protein of unknown function (DUF4056)